MMAVRSLLCIKTNAGVDIEKYRLHLICESDQDVGKAEIAESYFRAETHGRGSFFKIEQKLILAGTYDIEEENKK